MKRSLESFLCLHSSESNVLISDTSSSDDSGEDEEEENDDVLQDGKRKS